MNERIGRMNARRSRSEEELGRFFSQNNPRSRSRSIEGRSEEEIESRRARGGRTKRRNGRR